MSLLVRSSTVALTLATFGALASCGGDNHAKSAPPSQVTPPTAGGNDAGPAKTDGLDYLILAAKPLAAAANRLKTYRESTGHTVAVGIVPEVLAGARTPADATQKIHAWVKERYDKRDPAKPFFLVLFGDALDDTVSEDTVPAATFIDSTKTPVLTDNTYADMDGDDIPDLAVGRISVGTEAEANLVLEKTKHYESTYEVGAWNQRLSLFASTAGFGTDIDAAIEGVVFKVVEEIPYDYDINLTYAKQTSPYVYVPEKFSDKVYERMNEGSLMMTYVGHGSENSFASLEWNSKSFPILDTTQLSKIAVTHKPPVLSLVACLTGRFTADSLSEQILKSANGPVAVYSSTEVSNPYANAVFIRELAQTVTAEHVATIGEVFARAKRRMMQNGNDPLRKEIDAVVPLTAEVRAGLLQSHLYMYELFGDPAARIGYPRHTAKVTAPTTTTAGADVDVRVAIDGLPSGTALVTLEDRRSTDPRGIAAVPADGDPTRDGIIDTNYGKANDRILAQATATIASGSAQAKVTVPATLTTGDYWIKVYANDGTADAVGSAKISVP